MLNAAADDVSSVNNDLGRQWIECMRHGDFASAWHISDLQLRQNAGVSCRHLPRHVQYVWDGTPLTGKRVLIRCYHGLGDTIQFVRYMPMVEAAASEVFLWLQSELIPLVRAMQLRSTLLPLTDGCPDADCDVDAELMELPYIFRTTLASIPAEVPYIPVDPLIKGQRNLAVGLVWQAGQWDERRNVPFPLFAPLMELPGISFYILQRGPAISALKSVPNGILFGSDDPFTAARIVKSLNLVISVDSMPAHLAGAIGTPVWTLLPAEPDWRWMLDRADSPWYPTMRLFRQKTPGDWESVIDEVKLALVSLREHKLQADSEPCSLMTVLAQNAGR